MWGGGGVSTLDEGPPGFGGQVGTKIAQDGHKMATRWPKMVTRGAQEVAKCSTRVPPEPPQENFHIFLRFYVAKGPSGTPPDTKNLANLPYCRSKTRLPGIAKKSLLGGVWGSLLEGFGTKVGAKLVQDGPKLAQGGPKLGPRGSPREPKRAPGTSS